MVWNTSPTYLIYHSFSKKISWGYNLSSWWFTSVTIWRGNSHAHTQNSNVWTVSTHSVSHNTCPISCCFLWVWNGEKDAGTGLFENMIAAPIGAWKRNFPLRKFRMTDRPTDGWTHRPGHYTSNKEAFCKNMPLIIVTREMSIMNLFTFIYIQIIVKW